MRILLVEDDAMLADGLREMFGRFGFSLDHLRSAEPAVGAIALTQFDLLVVDLGLPGMDGLELIRRVRGRGDKVPILILTARDALEDRVRGLNEGADDYLVKPFAMPELMARVQALIRRSQSNAQSVVRLGSLTMDFSVHEAQIGEQPLPLTGREWNVLQSLLLATPRVLTKGKLTDSLSQWDKEISNNAVEIYVSRLRTKLQGSGVLIRTVRGIGYRLEEGLTDEHRG
ncbi:MAG: DNA-binding response regulator [Betaproteobacteria bacterium HGW-Betaproteobacteria-3]|jgi:DNA-binding response OmpR family regulator|nr:MAG: DNA-binding response regulator [Betaproteobacteria bacterium HGW-Betaproteobacteria-3]